MVREITHNEAFFAQRAEPATLEDLPIAQDPLDTLTIHKESCVSTAANVDVVVCGHFLWAETNPWNWA